MANPKPSVFKKVFFWPSKNIALVIPLILAIGFLVGLVIDTRGLKQLIFPITVLMIYPTMIGFKAKEIFSLAHSRLLMTAMGINFVIIPIIAFFLGKQFLLQDPQLFAGLAITALLPTSNMTIAFTMLAKGNVPGAIKMTTTGLILGAILAPWYLLAMVGKYVPIDILLTIKTIALVILLPLILGIITYSWLMKRYTEDEFKLKIKPYLPASSTWGMLLIIFISMSINAERIASRLDIFAIALAVQLVFYLINYTVAVLVGRFFFAKRDGIALVYATALRNLSISIGLAATAFGANAALMVSLAFLIQGQAAAGFMKLNDRLNLLGADSKDIQSKVAKA